jgi:excisionase family DNA binding protein
MSAPKRENIPWEHMEGSIMLNEEKKELNEENRDLNEKERQTNQEEVVAIPGLLTAKEVGKMLGISARAVNRLAREGKLGCVQLTSRDRRFTQELVEEFVKAVTVHRDWTWDVGY